VARVAKSNKVDLRFRDAPSELEDVIAARLAGNLSGKHCDLFR
jgi:hypothetical protein